MKRILLSVLACLVAAGVWAQMPADSTLRRWAAQMLMVGFRGDSIDAASDAARYVRDLRVGGIILFDVDLTGSATIGSRNITSRAQLAHLTATLRRFAGYPLIIAADQEGGKVQRLKPPYGYEPIPSAQYIGTVNNPDTTRHYGALMATQLSSSGVNLNLAPDVDVYHPDCPAIGKLQRSYGDTARIVRNAALIIDEHHRQGVLCALKHFPGHGSATTDSHWGFVDVTGTWSPAELAPFARLIDQGRADVVMTAHIFNRRLDPDYPATLSRRTIQGLLRDSLHYDGVVLTDDLYMEGIINHFSIDSALVLAINAGADMLCVGNNINTGFEADRPFRLVDMIVQAVKDGRIPWQRLEQSHRRLNALAARLRAH